MQWIYDKTVNFRGIYFSLAETFEVFWSLFVEGKKKQKKKKKTLPLDYQPGEYIWTNWHLEPHDYQIYYVNVNMEFLSLSCKRLSWWNVSSGEQGQMAVFTGSDEDSLTDIFNLITVKSVLNLVNLHWASKTTECRVLFVGSFSFLITLGEQVLF